MSVVEEAQLCASSDLLWEEIKKGGARRGTPGQNEEQGQPSPYASTTHCLIQQVQREDAVEYTTSSAMCAVLWGKTLSIRETRELQLRHTRPVLGLLIQLRHVSRVTDDILAMARPSTASIAARNIIQQFHSWGIRTVINLQTAGEHASCGPPLTTSGFTYDPNIFMTNDIYYYNFAWPDYGEASLSSLLDMVKVLSFAFQEGRVAIHCHAGLGRTGVLIACYLVYALRIKADDAIRLVRKRRPRSVQMSCQIFCVQQFQHYLLPQTVVFSTEQSRQTKEPRTSEFTLRQYLYRQMVTLHGADERAFREIPKIVYCLCERLLYLCGCSQNSGLDLRVRNRPFYKNFISHRLKQKRPPEVNEDIQTGQVTSLPMVEWRDPVEEEVERNLESVSRLAGTRSGVIPAILVYEAFMTDHQSLPEERRKHLERVRARINQRSDFDKNIDEE
ncbi:tyrosine phosphatase domain-containing protein 1, partial [Danaus plexippus plexippus]